MNPASVRRALQPGVVLSKFQAPFWRNVDRATVGFILFVKTLLFGFAVVTLFARASAARFTWFACISIWSLMFLAVFAIKFTFGHWAF